MATTEREQFEAALMDIGDDMESKWIAAAFRPLKASLDMVRMEVKDAAVDAMRQKQFAKYQKAEALDAKTLTRLAAALGGSKTFGEVIPRKLAALSAGLQLSAIAGFEDIYARVTGGFADAYNAASPEDFVFTARITPEELRALRTMRVAGLTFGETLDGIFGGISARVRGYAVAAVAAQAFGSEAQAQAREQIDGALSSLATAVAGAFDKFCIAVHNTAQRDILNIVEK